MIIIRAVFGPAAQASSKPKAGQRVSDSPYPKLSFFS
jgi:hypothetical protein